MTESTVKSTAYPAKTTRKDAWWLEPSLVAAGFTLFIVYATWRAFENHYYEIGSFLSPFYSPKIVLSWWKFSPAILILWVPAGFRATCYYYRKAYYRAYFGDPRACAVDHKGLANCSSGKYCGETSFPWIFQNAHRYFFYLATVVLAFLWWDVFVAFYSRGHFQVTAINLFMLLNVILLSGYSGGCHACRHLVGGRLDCFSSCTATQTQFKIWHVVTKLNEHHMLWAWLSLFSVGWTDFIIRQLACGAINDIRFL